MPNLIKPCVCPQTKDQVPCLPNATSNLLSGCYQCNISSDFELLGFKFGNLYYYDKSLPMGASISCLLFETFATFLDYKTKMVSGADAILRYLDDFYFAAPKDSQKCSAVLDTFQRICATLGVPLAPEKTEGPTPNTLTQEVKIPQDKLLSLQVSITKTLESEYRSLQSILSL